MDTPSQQRIHIGVITTPIFLSLSEGCNITNLPEFLKQKTIETNREFGFLYNVDTHELISDVFVGLNTSINFQEPKKWVTHIGAFHTHPKKIQSTKYVHGFTDIDILFFYSHAEITEMIVYETEINQYITIHRDHILTEMCQTHNAMKMLINGIYVLLGKISKFPCYTSTPECYNTVLNWKKN